MRAARLAIAMALAAGLAANEAHANGRFPAANQLVVAPSDPNLVLVRTTFGLLLSKDGTKNFDWVCEAALGTSGVQDPSIAIAGNDALTLATAEGLLSSPDTGCAWSFYAPLAKVPIDDVVVRPDAPTQLLALARKLGADDDAGFATYTTQVWGSTDNGASWTKVGVPLDPGALTATIEIAKSDPQRIYVSGIAGHPATATKGYLYVSANGGASWTAREIPFDGTVERNVFIAAVDPANADVVYVRTSGNPTNRLFVTTNAGQTWTQRFSGSQLLGFALSPDGSKVWVGGPTDGVNMASTSDFVFAKKSSLAVNCLTSKGGVLYACADTKTSSFVVGASTDDGVTFAPTLRYDTIRGAIACTNDASAVKCAEQWPAVRDQLVTPDGGADDSGAQREAGTNLPDAGSSTPPPSDPKTCGCHEASTSRGLFSTIALVLATLFALGRARRR